MSVYVDDMRWPYGRMIMCHMIADESHQLRAMASYIGIRQKWIQDAGTPDEHFDICLAKRRLAVKEGAIEITRRTLIQKLQVRRKAHAQY